MNLHFFLVLFYCTMLCAQAQGPELYFTLNGTVYLHGDTVLIADIGVFMATTLTGAGSSLVCDTGNVNVQCCRGSDGGNVGDWFFPNGSIVLRNSGNRNADFTRSGFTHQVRLNRRNDALMPTGEYSYRVPDGRDSTLTHMATITLIAVKVSIPAMLSVTEGDGMVPVCAALSITPATAITSRAINVSLVTSNDTATSDLDYIPLSVGLTFPTGSSDGNLRCLNISININDELERDETFTVTLTTPDPGVILGDSTRTTITITGITVSIPAMLSVVEGNGIAKVCATLTGSVGNTQGVTVTLETSDGTALAGSDYFTSTSPIFLTSGSYIHCINVSIINDDDADALEEEEHFTVTLTASDPHVMLGNNITIITILDDDDVNECLANTDDCDINALCTNTPGSFTCTCNPGYSGNGHLQAYSGDALEYSGDTLGFSGGGLTCLDIDECAAGTAGCDTNALCTNTPGNFTCTCSQGYSGDGIHCSISSPVVSISVSPGPLVAGGAGETTLNCSAMVDQAVLNGGMIQFTFTWLDGDGDIIVSDGRTTITPVPLSLSTSHYSTLTLSPLSTVDTNFTCGAAVVQNRISSEIAVVSISVKVITPADPVVEITSSSISMAGTTLTLACTVTLLQQLRETPVIVWVGPDGTEIGNGTIADVTVSPLSPHHRTLVFSPLHTNYGGEYRCRASLDIAEAGVSITNCSTLVINVLIPPPTVTITGSPVDSDFFTGLRLNLTCSIHIPQELHSQPVQVSAHWTKGGSTLVSNSRLTVEEGLVRVGPLLYHSTLVFISLDESRDSGEYSCTGSINSSTSVSVYSIAINTIFFQLELLGIADCQSWRLDDPSAKDRDLVDALVENVVPRCGCDFSGDRITDRVFQCFPSSLQSVTYHAQLHGTLNANASELFTAIEEWVSSGVTIPVQFLPLIVSSVCAVSSSTPLEHCPGEVTMAGPSVTATTQPSTTDEVTTEPEVSSPDMPDDTNASGTFSTTPIIIAASVGVMIAIATVIAIAVTMRVCRRHQHSATGWLTSSPGQMVELNPLEGDHDYEDTRKYGTTPASAWGTTTGDYGITKCPAYDQHSAVNEESHYAAIPAMKESNYTTTAARKEEFNHAAIPVEKGEEESNYAVIPVVKEEFNYAAVPEEEKEHNYSATPVVKGEEPQYVNVPEINSEESNYAAIP